MEDGHFSSGLLDFGGGFVAWSDLHSDDICVAGTKWSVRYELTHCVQDHFTCDMVRSVSTTFELLLRCPENQPRSFGVNGGKEIRCLRPGYV